MKPSFPLLALCLGLVGGAVVGSSCGPAKPLCSPTTCTGCCDGTTGACVQIGTTQACGRNGETCKACSLGFVCSFGSCTTGNTGNGPAGGGSTTSGGSAGGGMAAGGSAGGNVGGGSLGGGNVGGGNVGGGSVGGGSVGGGNVGGGAVFCNSTNCSNGCCQGSNCIAPPSNANNATCGFAGFGCSDCTATGMVCNSTSFTCVPGAGGGAANPGDSCTNATPLTLVGGSASTSGSIVGYANDSTQCSGAGPDAVYSVTVPSSGTLQAQVFATGFTPRINIRSSCSGTPLACDSNPVAGSAQTSTTVSAGGTYFVWVDSSGASGTYSLTVTSSGAGGGSAGGAAGGGSVAGGSAGGGIGGGSSGTYLLTSITASCDTVSTGTQELAAIADDAATSQASLPIAFSFFGQSKTLYTVSSNGLLQVWSGTGTGTRTGSPTGLSTIPGAIAPFWDDLDNVTGTDVRSLVLGSGTTRRFVVEWSGWAFYVSGGAGSTDRLRFQAKLFENGVVEFHYCSLVGTSSQIDGSSAEIGIGDSAAALEVSHTPSTVSSGAGLRFTP